ncbi:hypothetical protein Tco_0011021 [Tanacetum coccineum]
MILGANQLTKGSSSSEQKDLVFVKSSTKDSNVSKLNVERPWISDVVEGNKLPNHDTSRVLPSKSPTHVTNSLVTEYDLIKESNSLCSTLLLPLEKLQDV